MAGYHMNTPWVGSPFLAKELNESPLDETTQDMVRQYAEKGYLILETGLPESTFDRIIELLAPHYSDPRIQGSKDVGQYNQYKLYKDFVQALMEATGQKKEVFHVKKGQALIWSANLFHGGSPFCGPAVRGIAR